MYGVYCSNQPRTAAIMNKLTNVYPKFKAFLQVCFENILIPEMRREERKRVEVRYVSKLYVIIDDLGSEVGYAHCHN